MPHISLDRIRVDMTANPPQVWVGDSSIAPSELVDELDLGTTRESILDAYPQLTAEDLQQAETFMSLLGTGSASREPIHPVAAA